MKSSGTFLASVAAILLTIGAPAQTTAVSVPTEERSAEIRALRRELESISARLAALEAEDGSHPIADHASPQNPPAPPAAIAAIPPDQPEPSASSTRAAPSPEDASTLAFLRGTTLAFGLDGYYGYNLNAPVGRVNLLRVYDVSSNSFSINQASFIAERLPTPADRIGGRIDLQFGQATETLQGSSANEQRPQVWRNLFQAYGSYLAPVGTGLQIDFGKWASALGNEGNYTKDQLTYSRSFSFDFLPFYHMGLRANYNITPRLNVAYWLVNGANDTEDLNGFKSQAFILTLKPASSLSWNLNYYFGQEARDVAPTVNPGTPTAPVRHGLPTTNIAPAANGREHIFDTYATWNATRRLTFVPEADFVISRDVPHQRPSRVVLGSVMARYTLPHAWTVAARGEYFDDRGGLFSGKTQALKEGTFVLDHLFAPGFLARAEYRRDFSNQPFFLTDTPSVLTHAQTTTTLGLVYWWGTKQGAW